MGNKKRAFLNFIFLAGVFLLTTRLVLKGEDLGSIWETMSAAKKGYLFVGMACVVLFILGESVIIYYMLRSLDTPVRFGSCAMYSFVGFFFSCITPSASGGQPMQIYYMKKDRLPIPVTTQVLLVVTITYKAVLVVIGLLTAFFGGGFLRRYMGDFTWVFYMGLLLNVICVALMLFLVFAPGLAKNLAVGGLRLLERFRLLKPDEDRLQRLEDSMDQYHATADFWKEHREIIPRVFALTFVQRCFLFTVTYWVYRALGLHAHGLFAVTLLQAAIAVSVDMLPLPGGMGISESLYMVMFLPVFGRLMLPSMLLSRGIAYYGQMLLSAFMTCIAQLTIGRVEAYK
ncbi:MAG: lysylphosphatidylglycerol synthase transmembrane domain-containing protein [Eubacteriales bacterium]|nr:lysylphosphatidylglycerol synthase transmembrane domain-containing protein [Eubacteriales bacterium]